ncbi:Cysteine-rich venom protein [Trichinella spiralis]|uniref:Cysteine-rich venom protein n=1 Tax=Trichinella spiralis TaxID=6334 RepID=A0ABR3KWU3_TRISP
MKAVLLSVIFSDFFVCGPNEIYKQCGTACPATCEEPNPSCSLICASGCFCLDGLVRARDGKCVKLEECPASDKMECNNDEEFDECEEIWCAIREEDA